MGRKLYIGNLSYEVGSTELTTLFNQVGTVDTVKVITDRDTGRSKGFAFMEMGDASEAQAAIEKFNGHDLSGRAMNVSEAKPQAPRDSRDGGFGSRRY